MKTKSLTKKKYLSKIQELEKHNKLYYDKSRPVISDSDYDRLKKDIIELDRRVNLLYSALEGKIMRIFPIPEDVNNKWVSYPEVNEFEFNGSDSLYVNNVLNPVSYTHLTLPTICSV